ncbi:MAG: hypothetical protein RJA87_2748, partial [Pseudomonadota bacterium]
MSHQLARLSFGVKSILASPSLSHSLEPAPLSRRSSVVERIIGNAEVGSSILPGGTSGPSVRK